MKSRPARTAFLLKMPQAKDVCPTINNIGPDDFPRLDTAFRGCEMPRALWDYSLFGWQLNAAQGDELMRQIDSVRTFQGRSLGEW
jgi:hypothetical protein